MPRRERRVVGHPGQQRHHPVGEGRQPDEGAQRVPRIAVRRVLLDQRPLLRGPLRLGHRRHARLVRPLDEDRAPRRVDDGAGRLDAEEHGVVLVGQHVEIAVGPLPHVADPLPELGEYRLAPDLLAPAVEHDAIDVAGAGHPALHHRADHEVALPRGKVRTVVERQPRRPDRRPPEHRGILELRPPWRLGHPYPGVLAAVGSERPPVVRARPDDVRLVAPLRSVLGRPQLAGLGMPRQTELVPVAQREDLRQIVGVARERVVGWRRAVLGHPHQLAEMGLRVLRVAAGVGEDVGPAHRHVERAVGAPDEARRGDAAVQPLGHEDIPHLGQRPGVEAPAGQGHRHPLHPVLDDRLAVGQVDHPVVLRMHRDVHETGATGLGEDLGHAGDVAVEELAVSHHPQRPAVALGHEDVAVAAERHAPRMRQPGGDRHHPDARHLGRVQHPRPGRCGHRRNPVPALGGHDRARDGEGQAEREQRTAAGAAMVHHSSLGAHQSTRSGGRKAAAGARGNRGEGRRRRCRDRPARTVPGPGRPAPGGSWQETSTGEASA